MSEVEKCTECGKLQGYHVLGCTKCVHTNKNGMFGLECIGCGLLLDGPQYGKELRVFTPEEHGVLDYNTMPKVEVPDVVVEQGPNTNGDAVFKESAVHGALKQLLEQDIYKRTAEEAQQRMKDLADLSFKPAYVQSKPDPKSILLAAALSSDEGKKRLGEQLGIAILTNRLLIGRVRSFFPVQQVPGPCPEIEAAVRFHHEHPFTPTVGWDANGSPTEEWP